MHAIARYTVGLITCYLVPITSASTLVLSTHSSDETPASILDATLDFSVVGSTLTLIVSNDTADPFEYDLRAVFFNVLDSSNVMGLTLTSPAGDGWALSTDEKVACFGRFDYGLSGGFGNDSDQVFPGATETFTFEISGPAPFFDTDFTTEPSTIPPGDMPSIAAAKFVEGPGDDSAFGATVHTPEPATLIFLALGSLAILRQRRR